DQRVELQLVVFVYSRHRDVVRERTVCLNIGSSHIVSFFFCLCSHFVELVPVGQRFLHFRGIIGAQDVLRDLTSIDQGCRTALEGNALHAALGIGSCLDRVLVHGVGRCDSYGGNVQREVGFYILDYVVSLCQEHVDFLIRRSAILGHQRLVQLFLV